MLFGRAGPCQGMDTTSRSMATHLGGSSETWQDSRRRTLMADRRAGRRSLGSRLVVICAWTTSTGRCRSRSRATGQATSRHTSPVVHVLPRSPPDNRGRRGELRKDPSLRDPAERRFGSSRCDLEPPELLQHQRLLVAAPLVLLMRRRNIVEHRALDPPRESARSSWRRSLAGRRSAPFPARFSMSQRPQPLCRWPLWDFSFTLVPPPAGSDSPLIASPRAG